MPLSTVSAVWLAMGASCKDRAPDPESVLDAERSVLHVAEVVLIEETARHALEVGSLREAASAVSLGMELDPGRFRSMLPPLEASDDPDVLMILAKLGAGDLSRRALAAAAVQRYAAGVPVSLDGVTRARGALVLEGVQREYVAEIDLQGMSLAAHEHFELLAAQPKIRSLFSSWSGNAVGTTPLEQIDAAIAAGLPEAVAVAEGVDAALSALDPYTKPVWPNALAGWQEHHAGAAIGVGLALQEMPDKRTIVTALDVDGPAWRRGVHVGDLLQAVDGVLGDTTLLTQRLHGEAGIEIRLALLRGGQPLEIKVVRESIVEETVYGYQRTGAAGEKSGWEIFPESGIALLRIAAFRPHTDEQMDALLPSEPCALILDLRGNGGGDVMAAVNVIDRFVADGVLVTLEGRTIAPARGGDAGELPWNVAIPGHPFEAHGPLVVLVDRNTASAAEIVAGALRDRAGALLVGERTFGKGLSQALRVDEARGVGWQVTNGTWTLPGGQHIEPLRSGPGISAGGLEPDIELRLSPAERLQVGVLRRKREMPPVHPDGSIVADLGTAVRKDLPLLSGDPQLNRALALARSQIIAP